MGLKNYFVQSNPEKLGKLIDRLSEKDVDKLVDKMADKTKKKMLDTLNKVSRL